MRERLIARRLELDPPLSQEELAHIVGIHPKSLSKIERGLSMPHVSTRRKLAKALRWTMAELALALNDHGQNDGIVGHRKPSTLTVLASLEQEASEVRNWEPYVVPGLLQTAAYATAVESAGPDPSPPDDIARRVRLRMSRQAVLTRHPDPLRLFAIVDASVLQRVTGGPDVMAAQLDHLRAMAELSNVEIRVIPLDGRGHAAGWGAFHLLTGDGDAPFIACTSDVMGVHYAEYAGVVDAYAALFAHLWEEADALA